MDKINVKGNKIEVGEGDYLFMVSDGISEKKLSMINKFKNRDPQKIVREILNADDELIDDETVIVIKIKR